MLIDLIFTAGRRRAEASRLIVNGPGEQTAEAVSVDGLLPIRLNATFGLIVVTMAPTDNPELLVRWIARHPLTPAWQTLRANWDHTGQNWLCTIRLSPP